MRIRPFFVKAICAFAALVLVSPVFAPAPAGAATSPTVVTFTFDNQWANQMTAANALHAHGMAGTFYVISGWIGQSGFMTLANLQTLAAQGHEIGGKTVNNANLSLTGDPEAKREVCQGRNVLLADGFNVTDFAYPFAEFDPADKATVAACGFNSARGVGDVNSIEPGGCLFPDCPYGESIPPLDPFAIRTPSDGEVTTTLADLEGDVSQANNNGGGWLVFSFHQICDTSTPGCDPIYSVSPTLFNQFLDWLSTQTGNGVTVKTVQQVIGGATQPAITAATVPAAPIGTNALVNPTLTATNPYIPAADNCWSNDSYGTNSPTFVWSTTGGEGGGGMETVTMSNRVSGDAKLLTTFDLGQCSPTAVAGDSYSLGTYYKSTVPVFFTVYGRAADGTWSYWTQSPTFPASANWTLASWRSPPVPATIGALSFGLTIDSNGTLNTSNYSLVDQGSGVPPAAPVGVNALANPLLQTPDGSGANPVCWSPSGFGTNTANFTWSPTGGQTGGQETINMTSWTDGDAKLLTTFDNGNCAPTVTAGHVYTLSAYYKSSVPVFFTLYGRDTTGVWGYWTQTQPFPAASGWTLATFVAPVVPANINGASFGMTLASVGTLSTSNYSLVDGGPPGSLAPQVISFTGPGTGGVGGQATLTATGGGSGNPVVFSLDATSGAGVCTLSGTNNETVSYAKVGNCVIDANQAGNAAFAPALPVTQTIVVNPGSVIVNVSGSKTYGTSVSALTSTNNAPSGITVNGTLACTTVNAGTAINAALGAGSYTVDPSSCSGLTLSDPVNYTLSYVGVASGFVVNPAPQVINFTAPAPGAVGAQATLVATGGVSGNPVVFSVDATSGAGVCSVSGTNGATVSYAAVGNCVIDANQAGNANYAAAAQVSQTVVVSAAKLAETITFGALTAQTLAQSPVTVTATASSGLPVTFTTTTPAVCSASGTNGATIGLLGAGTCTVAANQAGDATYNAAPSVNQSFTVSKAAQTITFPALTAKDRSLSPVTVGATASSGLTVTFTTTTPAVCTSSGTNGAMITLVAAGTCTVSANQAGNTIYNAAPTVNQSFAVTVDTTAPTTTIRCNNAVCSTGWYRAAVSVTLTATDTGGAGLSKIYYTTDGTAPTTSSTVYSGAFSVSATSTVRFFAVDLANNSEVAKSQSIRIDTVAPTVTITAPANNSVHRRGTTFVISASASDTGGSGVTSVAFTNNGAALATDTTSPYSITVSVTATTTLGAHVITAVATDAAGNTRTSAPITVQVTV